MSVPVRHLIIARVFLGILIRLIPSLVLGRVLLGLVLAIVLGFAGAAMSFQFDPDSLQKKLNCNVCCVAKKRPAQVISKRCQVIRRVQNEDPQIFPSA